MKQTALLGVAAVLDAIGAFLASIHHYYSAYVCFGIAIVLAALAILVTYWGEYRKKRGREQLGQVIAEVSDCELAAYDGRDPSELSRKMEEIPKKVQQIAKEYFDSSIASRFRAVTYLDVQLDDAMKNHFVMGGLGGFWHSYQKLRAWRTFLNDILRELH